ncbi:MAG: MotA/TolQ/ExbB proton channel family protein [Candidatus Sumerlaeia bacterium]|nr:MotA/TolQ/ExbB proton channel family protein [Candidatus Sumerlaeia bacterium]
MLHLSAHHLLATVNPIKAIADSDWFGRGCLVLLSGLSVLAITLIFHKYGELRRIRQHNARFERIVRKDGTWEELFLASKENPESPLANLLSKTYVECRFEEWFQNQKVGIEGRLDIAKRTIEGILAQTITDEESRLQKNLPWLSTIAGLAPMIGLLGTVWGVLAAFQAIGVDGSSGIANLAPGVSTALTTTILGLIAAIPAFFFHNRFLSEISQISGRMETFSQDLENAVRKQILKED